MYKSLVTLAAGLVCSRKSFRGISMRLRLFHRADMLSVSSSNFLEARCVKRFGGFSQNVNSLLLREQKSCFPATFGVFSPQIVVLRMNQQELHNGSDQRSYCTGRLVISQLFTSRSVTNISQCCLDILSSPSGCGQEDSFSTFSLFFFFFFFSGHVRNFKLHMHSGTGTECPAIVC